MFITNEVRQRDGLYSRVTDRYMIVAGIERQGTCGICGHTIKHHYGVQSPAGELAWVGNRCLATLTNPLTETVDVVGGTIWEKGGKRYIVPTTAWLDDLNERAYAETTEAYLKRQATASFGAGGRRIRNNFLASIARAFEQYGQLTYRQYEVASQ